MGYNSFEISKFWLCGKSDYPYWASLGARTLNHRDIDAKFDQHSAEISPGVRVFAFKKPEERAYFMREYKHLGAVAYLTQPLQPNVINEKVSDEPFVKPDRRETYTPARVLQKMVGAGS